MNVSRRGAPLVGRRAELDLLSGALRSEQSTAVLIGGDAGVGKTRLVAEVRASAEQQGVRVLAGHCVDFGDAAAPYQPFVELFTRAAPEWTEAQDGSGAASSGPFPALARLTGRSTGTGDQVSRDALIDDIHGALTALGRQTPLLVVVEDVHWADRSTRDVLTVLLTRGFSSRVVLLVTYRSDDLHRRHPLRPTLAQWSRLDLQRLTLEPLTDAEITTLVNGLLTGPQQDGTVRRIVRRAEGNAFFAEELVGAQCQGDGLPDNLAELLLVKVDSLDEASRTVVRAAAAAGRTVEHDVLAAALELRGEEFETALRSAVDLQLLLPTATGYQFRHALVAESIYDDLLPGERRRLHQRYVSVLRDHPAAVPADLARHARAAGDDETAVAAGLRAAELAMKVGGPEEAVAQYERLADQLAADPLLAPDLDRIAVTGAWVEALMAAGHTGRAVSVARAMMDDLPPATPDADRAAALAVLVRAALMEDSPLAGDTLQEAMALLPDPVDGQQEPTPVVRARARLLAASARIALMSGRYERAEEDAEQASALARRHGWTMLAQDAATTAARLAEFTGDSTAAATRLDEVIRRAVEADDIVAELRARHYLGGLHLNAGDRRKALAAYLEGAERARARGRPWAPFGMDARALAGIAAVGLGEWSLADEIVDVTAEDPPAIARAALAVVALLVAVGRGDHARSENLLSAVGPAGMADGMIVVNQAIASIDLRGDAGDLPAARAVFDESIATLTAMWETDHFQGRIRLTALLLGQVATRLGPGAAERADAVALADALVERLHGIFGPDPAGRQWGPESRAWWARTIAERHRVRWLAGAQGQDVADLSRTWEQVVALFDTLGDRFEAARSRTRWAAVLAAAGDPRARQVADDARDVAQRLGAAPLLAELGTSIPDTGRDRDGEPAALTSRELQIVRLVADGRSNGEIGRQLFISTKTVSVHVSNLMAKLGAKGRTEAAAVARDRGLL